MTVALCWIGVLCGCAAHSGERPQGDAEYREGERLVQLEEFRRQCEAQGGYVYTEGTSTSRIPSATHRSSRLLCATKRRGSIVGW
ncbi:MAG: hypothetical protein AAF417_00335 [Pseudomonadota bacterium]